MQNKRILVIDSGYLLGTGGTAETMRSLFSVFPKENIYNLCVNPFVIKSDSTYAERVRVLPEWCVSGRYLAGRLYRFIKKERIENSVALKENKTEHIVSPRQKGLSALLELLPLFLDKRTKASIIEFNPDVVYTTGASIRVFKYTLKVSKLLNKHIVIHYLDDYVNNNIFSNCGPLSLLNTVMMGLNRKCIKRSNCILCISQKMAREYSNKFRRDAYIAMNTCKDTTKKTSSRNKPIKLIYCGSMNINRDKIITEICKKVDEINKSSIRIELNIYSSGTDFFVNYLRANLPIGVYFKGLIPHSEVKGKIAESDICIYAEDLNEESEKYCRLSFSTKIPEFLSEGKPILCVAPEKIAACEYLKENNVAYFAHSEDQLGAALSEIIEDDLYKMKKINAYNCFDQDLSWEIIIKEFETAIDRSAE